MSEPFPPGRWRARWIWADRPPIGLAGTDARLDHTEAAGTVLLRRAFEVRAAPGAVPARMTADSRYVLWVNGVEVARGPARDHWQRLHADVVDLGPHLRAGRNVVAVCARRYARANPWWMPATPTYGLGGGAFAFEALLADGEALGSDAGWLALAPPAWTDVQGQGIGSMPPEVVDARALPAGWEQPDFDDGSWPAAVELSTTHTGWPGHHHPPSPPYGALPPAGVRTEPGRVVEGRVVATARLAGPAPGDDPVTGVREAQRSVEALDPTDRPLPVRLDAPAGDDDGWLVVVDLGEQTAGTVELAVDAPAGTVLDAQVAEARDPDGRLEALDQHNGFRYVARGSDDRWATFDRMGQRFVALAVRDADGPVTIERLAVRERLRPSPEGPWFACSDPDLERIWRIGRRTVDLCAQDAYLDCPSREQRAWTGDAVVHQLVDLTTNLDWSLAVRNVALGAAPRPDGMLPMAAAGDFAWADQAYIPDWALHWIHAVHNLWRYVDDPDLVAGHLATAEGVLRWFEPFRGPDGLVHDVTGWVIIDWSAVSGAGTSGALNALYARALRDVAEMAEGLDDHGRARWARRRWSEVAAGFERFWDGDRGLYRDHPVGADPVPTMSQHTNAAALAAGLVPADRMADVVAGMLDPDALLHASWLMPGREATLDGAGDMYAGFAYLAMGTPDPWWDRQHRVVRAQPFFRYVVHDAVVAAGRADLLPDLCRDWLALVDDDTTTWRETWFGGSHCHGWCATPTRDLVQHTLGVQPAGPGFRQVAVRPNPGGLARVAGAVPTPAGLVEVTLDDGRLVVDTPMAAVVATAGGDVQVGPGRHELDL